MDLLTRDHLNELFQCEQKPCVSIYMSTHLGPDIRQDDTRCKNLINAAIEQLQKRGCRLPHAREILEPAHRLQVDGEFWRNQSGGLAVFAAPGFFRAFRLPWTFEEQVHVAERFRVRPLVPLLQFDGQFHVLAVSQNRVRLFRGTRFTVQELHPDHLPENLREALSIDEFASHLNFHLSGQTSGAFAPGVSPGTARANAPIFHGQGGGDLGERKRDEIVEYFRRIDNALQDAFHEDRTPLVFAGVEYLFPIYRSATNYKGLMEEPVRGNPDQMNPKELHQNAWRLVEPFFQRELRKVLESFSNRAARQQASTEVEEVLVAAKEGRVDTLLVAEGSELWGEVNENERRVSIHTTAEPQDDDLLDYATVNTLARHGHVFVIGRDQIPEGKPLAALMRYPLATPSQSE